MRPIDDPIWLKKKMIKEQETYEPKTYTKEIVEDFWGKGPHKFKGEGTLFWGIMWCRKESNFDKFVENVVAWANKYAKYRDKVGLDKAVFDEAVNDWKDIKNEIRLTEENLDWDSFVQDRERDFVGDVLDPHDTIDDMVVFNEI